MPVGAIRRRAIPAQLAATLGIEAGEELEFDHIGDGTLQLRKT